ncbi:hypothetical protein Aconfl_22070 [Algoriphagus confluentis]|uniref:Glycosyltransferase RgtA/B/C/D-like domain-containing protein n=2 Tax=Algoriphagus confluentis TaxID=1697556 RepID=A0ABQ6PNK9_9BACT|nr:hypothetical protein Aconfl_22070 [Algoriphagus confluentis]
MFCFLILANVNRITNPRPLQKDSAEYLELSYHLAFNKTFSYDGVIPTNYREPISSFLNAVNIHLFTDIKDSIDVNQLGQNLNLVLQLTQINIFYLFLLYIGIWWLHFILTGSHSWMIFSAFIPMTYFSISTTYLKNLLSDLPSIVLFVFSACVLLLINREPKYWKSILLAILLGLLIMSKGVFYYLVPIYLFLMISLIWFKDESPFKIQKIKIFALSFLLTFLTILPWQLRNYIYLDDFSLTTRGGTILLLRAEMDQMNSVERVGMFYVFAPEVLKKVIFEKYFGYEKADYLDGGKLQRLNRDLEHDYRAIEAGDYNQLVSFLRRSMFISLPILQAEANLKGLDSDQYIKEESLKTIKNNWQSHILTSIPFAWKGLWFYKGNNLVFVLLIGLSYLVFFIMFIKSLIYWKIDYLIFFTLPMLVFFFHVLLTHNIPRYILPIVPFISLGLVLFLKEKFSVYRKSNLFKL